MNADDTEDETLEAALQCAGAAVRAASTGRWDEAERHVDELAALDERTSGMAAQVALMAWADALKDHILDGSFPQLQVLTEPGSQIVDPDGAGYVIGSADADMNLPPEILWASALIDARLAYDMATWERLYAEAPVEGFGAYVMAVLNCAAGTIRHTERGFARESIRHRDD